MAGDDSLRAKTKVLLEKANSVFYAHLNDYEYGMPYADEAIIRVILSQMVELGLTTPEKIRKVLQFLPKNSKYLEE